MAAATRSGCGGCGGGGGNARLQRQKYHVNGCGMSSRMRGTCTSVRALSGGGASSSSSTTASAASSCATLVSCVVGAVGGAAVAVAMLGASVGVGVEAAAAAGTSVGASEVQTTREAPRTEVQVLRLLEAELNSGLEALSDGGRGGRGDDGGRGADTQTNGADGSNASIRAPENASPSSSAASSEAREAAALIEEVWKTVESFYYDARGQGWSSERWLAIKEDALRSRPETMRAAHRCIRRMLARGLADPYTRFLAPGEFAAYAKYDVTGVGMNLVSGAEYASKTGDEGARGRSGGVFVIGLVNGSVAERAGIVRGDEIVSVDGMRCDELTTPFDVSSMIQGDEAQRGSDVRIVARNAESGQERELHVTRPVSRARLPVTSSLERGQGIGYVRLREMNALAVRGVKEAVETLEERGASRYVLDLRDNPGGLVPAGVGISELFLPEDSVVVSNQGRHPSAQGVFSTAKPPRTSAPLVVLVNGRTASSSEILAAALHDNCRATLVGDRTFGKGLIQSVFELNDRSGMIITVGRYVSPAGTAIDELGIVPDFSYMPSVEEAKKSIAACVVNRQSPL